MGAYEDWLEGDSAPWDKVNSLADSLGQMLAFAEKPSAHSGLGVGIAGGNISETVAGTDTVITCANNDDTYIVVHRTTGAITGATTTTNWDNTATYGRVGIATFASGVLTYKDLRDGVGGIFDRTALSGDVVGPASAVNDNLARFDGTTGKLLEDSGVAVSTLAPLASPAFTGNPTAPTASPGDNDTSIATTAFVTAAVAAGGGGGGSGSGTKTYAVFTPMTSEPPATNFATLDTRNSRAVLEFDAATEESALWNILIPEAASLGSGLLIRIHWMADTATSGDVVWGAAIERNSSDIDTDSFDTEATATGTANATSGIATVTQITLTTIDSIAAGEGGYLKIARKATSGSDTMTGDAQVLRVEVRSGA